MRVLGVDPGLARTGVAVVEGEHGSLRLLHAECLETPATRTDPQRLGQLFDALERVLREHEPTQAAVEQLFFSSNRRSAMRVSQARGVVMCVLARRGVEVHEYTPLQVKESVAGFGAAAKPQVARMACTLLGLPAIPGPDDVADACAIAICHHHRAPLRLAGRRRAATTGGALGLAAAVTAAQRREQRR